jgi:hypothetical protein
MPVKIDIFDLLSDVVPEEVLASATANLSTITIYDGDCDLPAGKAQSYAEVSAVLATGEDEIMMPRRTPPVVVRERR